MIKWILENSISFLLFQRTSFFSTPKFRLKQIYVIESWYIICCCFLISLNWNGSWVIAYILFVLSENILCAYCWFHWLYSKRRFAPMGQLNIRAKCNGIGATKDDLRIFVIAKQNWLTWFWFILKKLSNHTKWLELRYLMKECLH